MFSCEFYKIFKDTFLQNTYGRLLLYEGFHLVYTKENKIPKQVNNGTTVSCQVLRKNVWQNMAEEY